MAPRDEAGRISQELRSLIGLDIEALRAEWRRRFAAPPPKLRGPDLMRRALADAIQAEAFGRDEELEARIAALVRAQRRGKAPTPAGARFRPGTVLVREHQGRTHRVEVLDDGFLWEGSRSRRLAHSPDQARVGRRSGHLCGRH